jgi:cell division protein FtsL
LAAVDWFAAEAAPAAPAVRRRPRPAPKARTKANTRRRPRRLTGGIVWISAFAVLLVGIVAVNVAVLRTNVVVDRLDRQQLQLQAQIAALTSQVSSASASLRIERAARRFGLVPAPATDTSYLDLERR